LTGYDCTFDTGRKSFVDISRNGKKVQVWYGGEARDVEANTVHHIRQVLELDEAHGYDSDVFYNKGKKVSDFVMKYRRTLDRLAKM
jgi:hypothetical protein